MRFPTREDYIRGLIDQGVITHQNELSERPELVYQIQKDWMSSYTQIGCAFAKLMAGAPEKYRWHRMVVPGRPGPEIQELRLEQNIISAWKDPDAHALSLIFPDVNAVSDLADLMKFILHMERWSVVKIEESDEIVRLGMRFSLSRNVTAFAICLGPHPSVFPKTRISPFTELALPLVPKSKPKKPWQDGYPHIAHLADVNLNLPPDAESRIWSRTKKYKREVLGGRHDGARAKVTLTLPRDLWK